MKSHRVSFFDVVFGAIVVALLAFAFSTQFPSLARAQSPPQNRGAALAPVTPKCYITGDERARFSIPAFPGDTSQLVGIHLTDVVFGHGTKYGFENVTDQVIGVVRTSRYLAHRINVPDPTISHGLNQPSWSEFGDSDWVGAFDGTIDALGFDPHNPSSPLPAGASGYWGGPPVTETTSATLEFFHFDVIHPTGKSYWGGVNGRVQLTYQPWGHWSFLSSTYSIPDGHWNSWVDRIHGQILSIGTVVYEVDTDDDGVLDSTVEIDVP